MEKWREVLKESSNEIKKTLKYFENLSKLSELYLIVKFNLNIKFKLNIQMNEIPEEFKKL